MSSFVSGPGEFNTNDANNPQITIKGLSTDTKPSATVFVGRLFFETDTSKLFIAYGGNWNIISSGSSPGVNTSSGSYSQSGDASTKIFNIPHGLAPAPSNVLVLPNSIDALGDFVWTINATNIVVTYQVAPPSGIGNLTWSWIGK